MVFLVFSFGFKELAPQALGHSSGRRPGSRKRWSRFLAGLALAAIVVLSVSYFAAPWLNRRLGRYFEDLIGATLNMPVVIESVQTSPFSELKLTRLRSVSAAESGKVELAAREISFYYDPVALLGGRLERLVLSGPTMFLNLDSDLEGIAQVPRVSPPSVPGARTTGSERTSAADYLPFSIAETVIESGVVLLGMMEGRVLELQDLRLSLLELGKVHGQSFELSTRAFGARITARGALDLSIDGGRLLPRYAFRDVSVRIEGLELRRSIDWLRGVELADDEAGAGTAPETLTGALLDVLGTASGLATLEGTLGGVWPERVELELRSVTTALAARYSPSLGVTDGEAKLRARVIALGRFETLSFDLEAEASGRLRSDNSLSDEAVTVIAKGEYARRGGGALRLDALDADFRDTGRLELQGEIAPLEGLDGHASPRIDLTIDTRSLDAERLFALRLVRLPPGTPARLAGDIDMSLRARGPVDRPRLDGTITLPLVFGAGEEDAAGFPVSVVAQLEGLEVDPRTLEGRLDTLRLSSGSIDLTRTLVYLPFDLGLDRRGISLNDARLDAAMEAAGLEWNASGVSGAVRATAAASDVKVTSEDLWIEATGVDASVSLETRLGPAGGELPLELAFRLELDEFLAGDVQASLAGEVSELRARGSWTGGDGGALERVALEELTIETPLSGRARGQARLLRGSGTRPMRLDVRLHATNVPTSSAFRTFVREPLQHSSPIVRTLELDGETAVEIQIEGPLDALRVAGNWHLSSGAFAAAGLELEGIQLDAPFAFGGVQSPVPPVTASPGRLRIGRIATAGFTLGDLDLPFLQESGTYTLRQPVRLHLFGGTLDVSALAFAVGADDGPTLEIAGRMADLDLKRRTAAYGWVPLDGHLDGVFQPVRYHDGRIEWKGSIDVKAFGGRLRSADFTIEDLFQPYLSFELREGTIENVRLRELGTTFNFGLVSGVARGRINDLEVVGGELTGFRIDFETVPVPGVPRFVNRRAVRSIRRILEGPFGDIEETLFGRFDYDRFGFTADLQDGAFRLRGKYTEGDHEYIMASRWYQFPRISIINASPGQDYDWDAIMETLREIYRSADEKAPGEE